MVRTWNIGTVRAALPVRKIRDARAQAGTCKKHRDARRAAAFCQTPRGMPGTVPQEEWRAAGSLRTCSAGTARPQGAWPGAGPGPPCQGTWQAPRSGPPHGYRFWRCFMHDFHLRLPGRLFVVSTRTRTGTVLRPVYARLAADRFGHSCRCSAGSFCPSCRILFPAPVRVADRSPGGVRTSLTSMLCIREASWTAGPVLAVDGGVPHEFNIARGLWSWWTRKRKRPN